MLERWFWGAIAVVAGILATVQILSIRQEAQIWDEGFEIVGGYQYLTTGAYRPSLENPPLERILEATPLLFLRPDLKGAALEAHNTGGSDVDAGVEFLYHNRIPADTILFAARLPMVAVTIGLVCVLAAWVRRRFGAAAGIVAAALFSLDPTVIAHGRYVKNDMTMTAMAFVAVIAWEWFLTSRKKRALIWSGVALGLALGSKDSAVFLLPVFLVLYCIHEGRAFSALRFLRSFAVAGGLAAIVILGLYAPYAGALLPRGRGTAGLPLRDSVNQATAFGRGVAWLGSRLGWRSHPYLTGLTQFAAHGGGTHPAYLWGDHGSSGWWYYFPFAFTVKTPVAVLIALALLIGAAIGRLRWKQIREAPLTWFAMLVPIAFYAVFSAAGHVDIGLRHLLPIYPFFYALLGAGLAAVPRLASRRPSLVGTVLLSVIVMAAAVESLAAYPYYTAFFNVLVEGPKNGPKYLVDSNIDWGQDLKRLGRFSAEHGSPRMCVMYFGTAPDWYYVPRAGNFPTLDELRQGADLGCEFAAVSVTPLEGVYVPQEQFAWLRKVPPLERVGYSIYVWDVHDPAVVAALAQLRNPK
jgi:Dolichyl-phosphate-mannose-protein mannosyltransferase/Alg9-like mannosyltransferase family